jgi:hypothetical protein
MRSRKLRLCRWTRGALMIKPGILYVSEVKCRTPPYHTPPSPFDPLKRQTFLLFYYYLSKVKPFQ